MKRDSQALLVKPVITETPQANDPSSLVSLCVCTYRRPQGIARAVKSLLALQIPVGWSTEIIVVDNDGAQSAAAVIEPLQAAWLEQRCTQIRYVSEPQPGVSHARNRCLDEARGAFIAFIDDDEYAEPDWLMHLWTALQTSQADAVFGPVHPVFEMTPPQWILSSGPHANSTSFATLSPIHWTASKTNNVLFRRQMIAAGERFSRSFTKTGGEDTFFFASQAKAGRKLVWCQEALVHETVPASRMSKSWFLSRCLDEGRTYVRLQAQLGQPIPAVVYYLGYALYGLLYAVTLLLPLTALWLLRQDRYMHFAGKVASNLGKVASYFHSAGHYGGGGQ